MRRVHVHICWWIRDILIPLGRVWLLVKAFPISSMPKKKACLVAHEKIFHDTNFREAQMCLKVGPLCLSSAEASAKESPSRLHTLTNLTSLILFILIPSNLLMVPQFYMKKKVPDVLIPFLRPVPSFVEFLKVYFEFIFGTSLNEFCQICCTWLTIWNFLRGEDSSLPFTQFLSCKFSVLSFVDE
jgi:hypothetical protein